MWCRWCGATCKDEPAAVSQVQSCKGESGGQHQLPVMHPTWEIIRSLSMDQHMSQHVSSRGNTLCPVVCLHAQVCLTAVAHGGRLRRKQRGKGRSRQGIPLTPIASLLGRPLWSGLARTCASSSAGRSQRIPPGGNPQLSSQVGSSFRDSHVSSKQEKPS